MGIDRKEHKEVEFTVATTAELEAQEHEANEDPLARAVRVKAEKQTGPKADRTRPTVPRVKAEVDDQMAIDNVSRVDDAPAAAAAAPTAQMEPSYEEQAAEEQRAPEEEEEQEEEKVQPKEELETEEDIMLDNLRILTEELGLSAVEVDGEGNEVPAPRNKDGRLYLFQFPPVMPPLRVVAGNGGAPLSVPSTGTATPSGITIKSDPDAAAAAAAATGTAGIPSAADLATMPSKGGFVGNLTVRRSGRVELDWGGTPLEIDPGMAMSFVTTAVIVEQTGERPGGGLHGEASLGGEAYGMGKIMGRFVAAPVWSEEQDWVVAPEDLVVDEEMGV
jgi:DNA-directed RNA polymerase III subunit RPC4